MPRWPQTRAGRTEAQPADTRGGIAPPRSNDALRSAPLTQGGFACSTQDTTHCANPPAATPTRCGSIGYGNNPAEAAPSLQHCQLRRLLRRGTAACGKLPVSAPPAATPALLSRSTRFENKNLALSATFLRLGAAAISLNTDIGSKVQQINCWEAFFRLLRVGEDCQSKKSCRKGEIFVFTLPKRHYWIQRHETT